MDGQAITALRMERQYLTRKANETEYIKLYRDMQPGQNVFWNGFGDPPSLTFRAMFDDIALNRERQARHALIKGRFAGGNLGWIMPEDLELFASLYRKPLDRRTPAQETLTELIEREGPITIRQMKEETGMLVKEITPILHRLQEAFLIYEDQYDGTWDRGWYTFHAFFPQIEIDRFSRKDALKTILKRFAFRHVLFDTAMAKSFYKLPAKELQSAIDALVAEDVLTVSDGGYLLCEDAKRLQTEALSAPHGVFAVHRNDFLYKSNEHWLKDAYTPRCAEADYDCDMLQYLLIDGIFHGACVGHFRNGPYDLNDVVCDLPDAEGRKEEILQAIADVNGGRRPARFLGRML